jgi:uncharacterized protein (DUF2236 family)
MLTDEQPRALGPDSLSWRYSGDWRSMLLGPWVAIVQLSYPALGAGVVEHSAFYSEPWDRFLRSVPQIAGVLYDGPGAAEAEARRIRDLHVSIKGSYQGDDDQVHRYHALNPETYFWAHATIAEVVVKMVDVFDHPTTHDERERMYQETRAIWRLYGMTDRVVPPDRHALDEYFQHNYANTLERTPAVTELIRQLREPATMAQPWLPRPAWRVISPMLTNPMWRVAIGMLAPETRETLGLSWSDADERQLRRMATAVRRSWRLVPRRLRYMPRARAGFRREGWPRPAW